MSLPALTPSALPSAAEAQDRIIADSEDDQSGDDADDYVAELDLIANPARHHALIEVSRSTGNPVHADGEPVDGRNYLIARQAMRTRLEECARNYLICTATARPLHEDSLSGRSIRTAKVS